MLSILQRIAFSFPKAVLSTSETANILNCGDQTVYKLIKTGKVQAYKNSTHGAWRVLVESVYDYQKSRLADFN